MIFKKNILLVVLLFTTGIMTLYSESSEVKTVYGIDTTKTSFTKYAEKSGVDSALDFRLAVLSSGIPAYEIYKGSWDADRLNPYKVAINEIIDSVDIDCSDFCYPTKSNKVTSNFGERWGRFHYGVDLGLRRGDTIYSTFGGKVRIVDYERRGYGRYIVVRHTNGLETIYAHLHKSLIKENDTVIGGQPIGLGGNTGRSTGPHLHYEIRFQGNAFNPKKLIDFNDKTAKIAYNGNYLLSKKDTYSHSVVLAKMKEARYCRVKSGDTLSHIARRYGTSVSRLCQLNKIRSTSILQIGQRVRYR